MEREKVTVIKKNGLDILIKLVENDGGLSQHIIQNSFFFKPDAVKKQFQQILTDIDKKHKIPVRYSSAKNYYDSKNQPLLLSNKREASIYAELSENDIYTRIRPDIKVQIDRDGNHFVREAIRNYTGEVVSSGKTKNTFQNYMISHVWGHTDDPFFFTSLWNIVIIPMHCSFILDKPDNHHLEIKKVKDLIKAICYQLYFDNSETMRHIKSIILAEDRDFENQLEIAKKYIDDAKSIQFM